MFDITSLFRLPAQQTKTVYFRKNQFIFCQGDRSDSLFYIEAGTVKLTVTSSTGKEALIAFYDAGHVFGESSLISDEAARFHNAIAVTNLRALRIDSAALLRRVRSDPTLAYALLTWSLARNSEIQQELVSRWLVSSEQRLARALCSVAQLGVADKAGLVPKLTQQDLANRIGLSRQRVNVLMTRLKKSGVIDRDGSVGQNGSLRKSPETPGNNNPQTNGRTR